MTDSPHIAVRTFELLVLFPLSICVFLAGITLIIERQWAYGGFLLVISFFIGVVGQSLPHRKKQNLRQLASGKDVGQRFGALTHEESFGLAKAVMMTGFLFSVVAGASAVHRDLPWYWVLAYIVCSWFTFPLVSMLFCFAWSWLMERMYGQGRSS